jgi:hypothetical protein
MKTNPFSGSPVHGTGETQISKRPIPGPERPLGSLGTKKTTKDTPKPEERNTDVSRAISGILSGIVPDRHLPMAVEDFQKKFPEVTDIAQVKGTEFFNWIDTLPLAHTVKGIKIV